MRRTDLVSCTRFALAAAALLIPAVSQAAGVYIPEDGAGVLARGGTSVGVIDTAYALEFNPAGMALVDGLDVRADINLTNPGESFQQAGLRTTVSNTGGISPTPYIAAVYRLPIFFGQRIAFGAGLWAPPGVLNYTFPSPLSTYPQCRSTDTQCIAVQTPQRYNNISQQSVVLYPAIGVAWKPVPWVSVGGTLQYIISSINLATSLIGTPTFINPTPQNDTANDILAKLKVSQKSGQLTGVVGIIVQPIPDLIFSGSFSPTQPIASTGSLNLNLGSNLNGLATVSGGAPNSACPGPASSETACLSITLPPVARAGVAYKWGRLTSAAEFHWEGWSQNKQFVVTTNAQSTEVGSSKPTPVGSITIVNDWTDSYGGRLGFAYDIFRPSDLGFLLSAAIGGLYETNAIPAAHQSLPYVTGNLEGVSAGVSAGVGGFGIAFSAMIYVPQTFTVTTSQIAYPAALPPGPAGVIGNGAYTTNIWELGIGLFYRGLDMHG